MFIQPCIKSLKRLRFHHWHCVKMKHLMSRILLGYCKRKCLYNLDFVLCSGRRSSSSSTVVVVVLVIVLVLVVALVLVVVVLVVVVVVVVAVQ